jgi:hypothetical protein
MAKTAAASKATVSKATMPETTASKATTSACKDYAPGCLRGQIRAQIYCILYPAVGYERQRSRLCRRVLFSADSHR